MICINKHNKLLKTTIGNYFRLKIGEFFVKQYLKFEKTWFGRFILDGVKGHFFRRKKLPTTHTDTHHTIYIYTVFYIHTTFEKVYPIDGSLNWHSKY
jgi:hypothetical protein